MLEKTAKPIFIFLVLLAFVLPIDLTASGSNISGRSKSPNILKHKIRTTVQKGEKITAAVLAFPLPFGIFGGHRIYLGTKPVVPITYIATIGGCFGILPLVDFCVILKNKDLEQYKKSSKIFMWNNPSR